jgi:hypothetical protein
MTRSIDLEINRSIRRVLVRHWIDLGRLSVRTFNARVNIRGALHRITGVEDELSPAVVDALFGEIERMKAIAQLRVDLENWTNDRGMWQPRKAGRKVGGTGDSQTRLSDASRHDVDRQLGGKQQDGDQT